MRPLPFTASLWHGDVRRDRATVDRSDLALHELAQRLLPLGQRRGRGVALAVDVEDEAVGLAGPAVEGPLDPRDVLDECRREQRARHRGRDVEGFLCLRLEAAEEVPDRPRVRRRQRAATGSARSDAVAVPLGDELLRLRSELAADAEWQRQTYERTVARSGRILLRQPIARRRPLVGRLRKRRRAERSRLDRPDRRDSIERDGHRLIAACLSSRGEGLPRGLRDACLAVVTTPGGRAQLRHARLESAVEPVQAPRIDAPNQRSHHASQGDYPRGTDCHTPDPPAKIAATRWSPRSPNEPVSIVAPTRFRKSQSHSLLPRRPGAARTRSQSSFARLATASECAAMPSALPAPACTAVMIASRRVSPTRTAGPLTPLVLPSVVATLIRLWISAAHGNGAPPVPSRRSCAGLPNASPATAVAMGNQSAGDKRPFESVPNARATPATSVPIALPSPSTPGVAAAAVAKTLAKSTSCVRESGLCSM